MKLNFLVVLKLFSFDLSSFHFSPRRDARLVEFDMSINLPRPLDSSGVWKSRKPESGIGTGIGTETETGTGNGNGTGKVM